MLQPTPAEEQEKFEKQVRPMDPAPFAEKALDAIARNKSIIIVPGWYRSLWWMGRLSPALEAYVVRRSYTSMRKRLTQNSET